MKATKKNNYRKCNTCLSCKFMVDTDGYDGIDPYCNYDNTYNGDLQWGFDKTDEELDTIILWEKMHQVNLNGVCDLWETK